MQKHKKFNLPMEKKNGFSKTWVPENITGKGTRRRRRRGTVACRSGGVVRPVRWPTHRLGLLPFSPPSHGHTHTQLSFISTLVSLSNCVEEERKKKKSNKKQRRKWKEEGEEEEKRKEKKEIKT
jgi:hypothetical protein